MTVTVSNALDVLTLTSLNPEALGNFGVSTAGVPDLDGDGRGDVLVGAWRENGGAEDAGRAYVFSGVTGARLRTLASPNPELDAQFGRSVAGVPDADGDGQGDLLVGAPLEDGGASNSGRAYLFSGATGELLRTLVSPTRRRTAFSVWLWPGCRTSTATDGAICSSVGRAKTAG